MVFGRYRMATPEPIATGTLTKTPLPHLLVYLEQKKLSGTLALWPDQVDGAEPTGAPDRLLMLKGVPMAGQLTAPAATLREGLVSLFSRSNAPYAFYDTNLLGDDRISGRIDPFALITAALRTQTKNSAMAGVLERFGSHRLRIVPNIELARYELLPEEREFVDRLSAKPVDLASLVSGGQLDEARARRLVYVLAITKAIAPEEQAAARESAIKPMPPSPIGAQPPIGAASVAPPPIGAAPVALPPLEIEAPAPSASPESMRAGPKVPSGAPMHSLLDRLHSIPPPPEGLSDELRDRWLRVVAKGRLVENQNHFEMLEIDKDTKSADARGKYYQLAKDWHPDRLPTELQPLREYVQIIFSYMSEAGATLGDETQRTKYAQSVREGGGTPATERLMQSILDTAMEYERVLVMARKHEYDDAIALMGRILAAVNDEPDYHAMYASLLLRKHPGDDAPLQRMLDSVNRALALHARHERANMLKGQILRRMGKPTEALEWFRSAAEINPRNIDAMREVRVASMRSQSIAPRSKSGGRGRTKKEEPKGVAALFGKLFKKP